MDKKRQCSLILYRYTFAKKTELFPQMNASYNMRILEGFFS